MEVLNLRPAHKPQDLAEFDLQIGPSLRLYNLAIRHLPNGQHRIFSPNAYGKHAASFAPTLAAEIVCAVLTALGGTPAHDNRNAA